MERYLRLGKRQMDKIPQFQKSFLIYFPWVLKAPNTCLLLYKQRDACVFVTIVIFLAATGNESGPRSRANERSYGTPWKLLDTGQVEQRLRVFSVVNTQVAQSLPGWSALSPRLTPKSCFKWNDRK